MISVPKIVLIIMVIFAVWYAVRWFNRPAPKAVRRGTNRWARSAWGAPRPQPAVEDLVACPACGAYVAASARGCGKAGCPRPA
jgi:hypothetical protein